MRTLQSVFRNRRLLFIVAYLLAEMSLFPRISAAREASSVPGKPRKFLAVLIGVTRYNRLSQLKWCKTDVELVERTLLQYCACSELVLMTGDSKEERLKPTRGNVVAVIESSLKFADDQEYDRVYVYFAGHGAISDGKLYLMPQDGTDNLIKTTGVSVAAIRQQIDRYPKIGERILILDTCHSGSTRGGLPGQADRDQLAQDLRKSKRLFTLASCQPDQQSLEWNDKEHGLFTYWLCRGLAGEADDKSHGGNGNHRVDTDELHEFVSGMVKRTSLKLGVLQTPVRYFSEGPAWKADLAFLHSDIKVPNHPATIETILDEANKYRLGGNYAAAIDKLNDALAIDPANPEVFALRGVFHLDRGKTRIETLDPDLYITDYQAAIYDFDKAIQNAQPGAERKRLASWHTRRCEALCRLLEYGEALKDATKAIELVPSSAQAYRNRAAVYQELKQPEKAEEDKREAARRGL